MEKQKNYQKWYDDYKSGGLEGLKEASEVIEFKNQQLKEKDEEIEKLKLQNDLYATGFGIDINYWQQQLKNLTKQLEHWQQLTVTQNGALTSEGLSQILKDNTKQVCDKIRKHSIHYVCNHKKDVNSQCYEIRQCILDKIEKGEIK